MSGWQLGLVLFGVLLAGFGLGIATVALYARHVYRQKVGQLLDGAAASLEDAAALDIPPPPPR